MFVIRERILAHPVFTPLKINSQFSLNNTNIFFSVREKVLFYAVGIEF